MPEQEDWIEEFDKKFTAVFAWITMNCMNEIIQGVDINHLHAILKEHIESLLSSQAHALKEQMIELLDEQVFEGEDECAGKLFLDWDKAKETLSAIESMEI